nr:hypothetical protein [Tanacetum cinerariifolium]
KDHKRKHHDDDDDNDPPAGPNQGKVPSKGSKTAKSASAKEPVEEPIIEEAIDDAVNTMGEDVTFPEIEFKELYTLTYKPPRVILEDLAKQKGVMRADELYKFSNGTLKKVQDELHHRILDFRLRYNDEMSKRKWTAIDKKRSDLMVELIDKQMRERRIIKNLERLVGAYKFEMDYKLITRTV